MWQAPLQSPVAAAEAHNKCLVVCMAASLRQLRPRCCATMFDRACPVRFAKNWLHGCHASSLPVRQLASTHMHTPLTSCTCSICDALVSSIANPHLTCFTHPSGLCMPPPPPLRALRPLLLAPHCQRLRALAACRCMRKQESAGRRCPCCCCWESSGAFASRQEGALPCVCTCLTLHLTATRRSHACIAMLPPQSLFDCMLNALPACASGGSTHEPIRTSL